jgi:hypothetical protein
VRLYLQKTPEKEELGWLKWKQLPIKCKALSSNPSTVEKKKDISDIESGFGVHTES